MAEAASQPLLADQRNTNGGWSAEHVELVAQPERFPLVIRQRLQRAFEPLFPNLA